MAITIKKVSSKKELKTFIRFNYELYKENPYSVARLDPGAVGVVQLVAHTGPVLLGRLEGGHLLVALHLTYKHSISADYISTFYLIPANDSFLPVLSKVISTTFINC